jgi:hypothetical protein
LGLLILWFTDEGIVVGVDAMDIEIRCSGDIRVMSSILLINITTTTIYITTNSIIITLAHSYFLFNYPLSISYASSPTCNRTTPQPQPSYPFHQFKHIPGISLALV